MNENKYSFKHSNIDLGDYIKNRKYTADLKRREAKELVKVAETIDAEMWELESNLLLITEPTDEVTK